jgi:hypothetical protein
MNMPVDLEDLQMAHEWLGACEAAGTPGQAYVSRATGAVHWCGDGIDEDVPEDIEDGTLYVAVPSQRDLHLGRSVALCFVEEQMPDHFDTVAGYFERRGAYARFKTLLDAQGGWRTGIAMRKPPPNRRCGIGVKGRGWLLQARRRGPVAAAARGRAVEHRSRSPKPGLGKGLKRPRLQEGSRMLHPIASPPAGAKYCLLVGHPQTDRDDMSTRNLVRPPVLLPSERAARISLDVQWLAQVLAQRGSFDPTSPADLPEWRSRFAGQERDKTMGHGVWTCDVCCLLRTRAGWR